MLILKILYIDIKCFLYYNILDKLSPTRYCDKHTIQITKWQEGKLQ